MGNLNEKKKSLLEKFTVKTVRKTIGDVDIYNAKTDEQMEILNKLINQSQITEENGVEKGSVIADMSTIRTLIREFTSIYTDIDEISDEELIQGLNTINSDIDLIVHELKKLYEEYANAYIRRMSDIMDNVLFELEAVKVKQKSHKILTEAGLKMSWEDFNNMKEEDIKKFIEESTQIMNDVIEKENNKTKAPQDHKKSEKPKQRRKSKKDKEEVKVDSNNPIEDMLDIPQENLDAYNTYQENVNDLAVKHGNDIETIGDIVNDLSEDKQ